MKTQTQNETAVPWTISDDGIQERLAQRKGGLFTYLAAVISHLAESSATTDGEAACAFCSDAILPTQVSAESGGKTAHAICVEMDGRKRALLRTAKSHGHDCSLCGQKVQPDGIYFHEGGMTLSYSCAEPEHDEPNLFSLPLSSDESRRVGMWEAKLRDRLREKGYVRCCECGRLIHERTAKLLGPGWHYCGCLPDLWRTGP